VLLYSPFMNLKPVHLCSSYGQVDNDLDKFLQSLCLGYMFQTFGIVPGNNDLVKTVLQWTESTVDLLSCFCYSCDVVCDVISISYDSFSTLLHVSDLFRCCVLYLE